MSYNFKRLLWLEVPYGEQAEAREIGFVVVQERECSCLEQGGAVEVQRGRWF